MSKGRQRRGRRRGLLGIAALGVVSGVFLVSSLVPPRARVPPPGDTLAHVTLVEPGHERTPGRTLEVRDGRISRVRAATPGERGGPYEGRFVLPGLVDLHVHHPPTFAWGERELFALLFLSHGVTSVRDTGTLAGDLRAHARRIAAGEIPGPRVFACGPVLDGNPPGWPGARIVESPAEARRTVAELAETGVHCIKAYNSLAVDVFQAVREEATRRGLRVVAHVPWDVPLEQLGAVEVQHLMGFPGERGDVSEVERYAYRMGFGAAAFGAERYARSSAEAGLWHTPTIVTFVRAAGLQDYAALRQDAQARLLPRYYRDLLWNPSANPLLAERLAPDGWRILTRRVRRMQETVRQLQQRGVSVLVGTDVMNPFVVPGASLHLELPLLAEAGLGAEGAWEAATRGAGRALGIPELGTLRPGAPADLLVFGADPTRDLAALSSLEAVVANGRIYSRAVLDAALARSRAHFDSPVYEFLSRTAARAVLWWLTRS